MSKEELIKRYCQTNKGKHIIATSMWNPIKLCRVVYKNGELHYKIGDKILNAKESENWRLEQQKIYRDKSMEYYSLTEDDFELSEEKLNKIIHDETISSIRNIGLIEMECGDKEELKISILNKITRITEIGLG